MKTFLAVFAAVCFLGVGAAAILVWSGVYNIGATAPHWRITTGLIGTLRQIDRGPQSGHSVAFR
jgi:hypothetical protein